MSSFKFSCPRCGQHIECDDTLALQQTQCPACQQTITIPKPGPSAAPPYRPASPAPSAYAAGATAAVAPRSSGLALASLICSCASFVGFGPVGFVPGIICGHMAKAEMRRDPALGGRGFAQAGLIVGYGALAVSIIVLGVFLSFFAFTVRTTQRGFQQAPPPIVSSRPVTVPTQSSLDPATQPAPPPIERPASAPKWTLDLSGASFPDGNAGGVIHGRAFNCEKAKIETGVLTLRQGKDFFADLEVMIFLFAKAGKPLDGKTWNVAPDKKFSVPHVYLKWKQDANKLPAQKAWTGGYALKLEFGHSVDGKLPGKIYVTIPDAEQSVVAGSFDAELAGAANK